MSAAIPRIVAGEPTITPTALFERLRREDFKPASVHSVAQLLNRLGRAGRAKKAKMRRGPRLAVALGSTRAKVMQAIWAHRGESNEKICGQLKSQGIKVPAAHVSNVRAQMRKTGMEAGYQIRGARSMQLTPEQQRLLPDIKNIIKFAVRRGIITANWPTQAKTDFSDFAVAQSARIARDFDPGKGKLSYFVARVTLPQLLSDFIELDLKEKLGIRTTDAGLLLYALGQRKAGKSEQQIAKAKKTTAAAVRELLEMYDSLKRTASWYGHARRHGEARWEG